MKRFNQWALQGFLFFFLLFFSHSNLHAAVNLKIDNIVSDGGVKYLFVEEHSLPTVSLAFTFKKAGYAYDPSDKQGLTRLMLSAVSEGSIDYTAVSFAEKVESLGIKLDFFQDWDSVTIHLKTLSENLEEGISLIVDTLIKPRVSNYDLDRLRAQAYSRLLELSKNATSIADKQFSDLILGNAYNHDKFGNTYSLKSITREEILALVSQVFDRENLIISVAGDSLPVHLSALFDKYIKKLPSGTNKAELLKLVNYPSSPRSGYSYSDVPQSLIIFGHPGVHLLDNRYPEFYLLTKILGGLSLNSLLMKELRDNLRIAYGVRAAPGDQEFANVMVGTLRTDETTAEQGIDAIKRVFKTVKEHGVKSEILDMAKTSAINSFVFSLSGNDGIVNLLNFLQFNNLGIEYVTNYDHYIADISLKKINDFAKSFIDVDNMIFVEVGRKDDVSSKT